MADDYRQEKLEDAIAKLTEISSDLNKMVAVHELRITTQEKTTESLIDVLERRRDEVDGKLSNVYNTMRTEDKNLVDQINWLREEASEQHEKLSQKITDLEKWMWTYMGAFSVVIFLLTHGSDVIALIHKI